MQAGRGGGKPNLGAAGMGCTGGLTVRSSVGNIIPRRNAGVV